MIFYFAVVPPFLGYLFWKYPLKADLDFPYWGAVFWPLLLLMMWWHRELNLTRES